MGSVTTRYLAENVMIRFAKYSAMHMVSKNSKFFILHTVIRVVKCVIKVETEVEAGYNL